jgi:phage shock protein E
LAAARAQDGGMSGILSQQQIMVWLPLVLVVAGLFLFKRLGQISAAEAGKLLAGGALIIDVRGAGEFADGHIDGAVNVPLGRLADDIARVAPDRSRPILVHCLSGTRSAMAKRVLRGRGYTEVHNLGSLGRARAIVAAARAR